MELFREFKVILVVIAYVGLAPTRPKKLENGIPLPFPNTSPGKGIAGAFRFLASSNCILRSP